MWTSTKRCSRQQQKFPVDSYLRALTINAWCFFDKFWAPVKSRPVLVDEAMGSFSLIHASSSSTSWRNLLSLSASWSLAFRARRGAWNLKEKISLSTKNKSGKDTPQEINELFYIYSMKILKKVVKSGMMMNDLCKFTITWIFSYLALRVSFFVLIAGASKWSSSANRSACALTTSILSYQGKITKTWVYFGRIQW